MTHTIFFNGRIVSCPDEKTQKAMIKKLVPKGVMFSTAPLPGDTRFADAWFAVEGESIIRVDMDAARVIAHQYRREARERAMRPLDMKVAARIPGLDASMVERERETIRNADAMIQIKIDAAKTFDELQKATP